MKHSFKLKAALAGTATAATLFLSAPAASAYPIDCAILLCLSGGWPASVECSAARAEFIRRITPWPIEPPLQIWRCPLGAAYEPTTPASPLARLYEIAQREEQAASQPQPAILSYLDGDKPTVEGLLQLVQSYDTTNGTSDTDISSPEFDFVRSIRVYSVEAARQYDKKDDVCQQYQNVKVGTYGVQGDFNWQRSSVESLPEAVTGFENWQGRNGIPRYSSSCRRIYQRSVFVDWRDYDGNYGFEQVNY